MDKQLEKKPWKIIPIYDHSSNITVCTEMERFTTTPYGGMVDKDFAEMDN